MEAEFIAAVTAAKTAKYIRLVLCKLGFKQTNPTPIYKDNKPTIHIIASQNPTDQTNRHIDICFFAMQDWIHKLKDIVLHQKVIQARSLFILILTDRCQIKLIKNKQRKICAV